MEPINGNVVTFNNDSFGFFKKGTPVVPKKGRTVKKKTSIRVTPRGPKSFLVNIVNAANNDTNAANNDVNAANNDANAVNSSATLPKGSPTVKKATSTSSVSGATPGSSKSRSKPALSKLPPPPSANQVLKTRQSAAEQTFIKEQGEKDASVLQDTSAIQQKLDGIKTNIIKRKVISGETPELTNRLQNAEKQAEQNMKNVRRLRRINDIEEAKKIINEELKIEKTKLFNKTYRTNEEKADAFKKVEDDAASKLKQLVAMTDEEKEAIRQRVRNQGNAPNSPEFRNKMKAAEESISALEEKKEQENLQYAKKIIKNTRLKNVQTTFNTEQNIIRDQARQAATKKLQRAAVIDTEAGAEFSAEDAKIAQQRAKNAVEKVRVATEAVDNAFKEFIKAERTGIAVKKAEDARTLAKNELDNAKDEAARAKVDAEKQKQKALDAAKAFIAAKAQQTGNTKEVTTVTHAIDAMQYALNLEKKAEVTAKKAKTSPTAAAEASAAKTKAAKAKEDAAKAAKKAAQESKNAGSSGVTDTALSFLRIVSMFGGGRRARHTRKCAHRRYTCSGIKRSTSRKQKRSSQKQSRH